LTKHVTEASPTVLTAACDGNQQDLTNLDELGFADLGAASAAGRIRRNGANLSWHNGTSASTIATLINTPVFAPATQSGTGSVQAAAGDLTLGAGYGSSTATAPVYAAGLMGNVLGTNLTATANILGGVIGKYDISGTNASTYPKAGVIGEIGDRDLASAAGSADAAIMAVLGGDLGVVTADAAFGVDVLNSTSGSGFAIGLDLYFLSFGLIFKQQRLFPPRKAESSVVNIAGIVKRLDQAYPVSFPLG